MSAFRATGFSVLLLAILVPIALAETVHTSTFVYSGKTVAVDTYGEDSGRPVLILLHGASGPGAPLYQHQARFFAEHGYAVMLVHYFDAGDGRSASSANYHAWAGAAAELVRQCRTAPEGSRRKIALLGFSLGASVGLSAASQKIGVDAVAEWYGSLPDEFFYSLKGMPPLLILHGARDTNIPVINAQQLIRLCEMGRFHCANHIYADQGHGFLGEALKDADDRTLKFLADRLR